MIRFKERQDARVVLLHFFYLFSGEKEMKQRKAPLLANCSAAKRSSPACFGSACNSICLRRGNGASCFDASFCLFSRPGYFHCFFALPLFHFFACFSALFLRTVTLASYYPSILSSCFRQFPSPIIILKYYIYGSIVNCAQPYENTLKFNSIYLLYALLFCRACPNKLYTEWQF